MRRTRFLAFLLACLVTIGAAKSAVAGPFFSIGHGQSVSWSDAFFNGNIQFPQLSSIPMTGPANAFYSTQVPMMGFNTYGLASTEGLSADVPISDGSSTFDSLLMEWVPLGSDVLTIAAWDYVYGVDPDLSNAVISFSLLAPPGIWDISIELIDVNNRARAWFIPGNPGGGGIWGNFQIMANMASPQGPFTVFFQDPLFDITQVARIRLDEAGNSVTIPNPDGFGLPVWNAWNHLTVSPKVPEPGSLTLLALGIAGMAVITVRRRGAKLN